jgi:NACalpha-BTF3-like transcription factor
MSQILRIPGGPGQPDRVKFTDRLGVIDISSAIEQRAREIAEAKMTDSTKEAKGISGYWRRLWRHNLLRDYYRQVEISKARQRILSRGEFYSSDKEVERVAQEHAGNAILERFLAEEPLLHPEAGERIHENRNTAADQLIKTQLTNLVREFATGRLSAEEFEKIKPAYINQARKVDPKAFDRMEFHIDNLLQIGQEVRKIVEAGIAIENIDIDLEVTLGRARLGARTETEFNRVDRVMEMISRSPLRPFERAIGKALGLMSSVHDFVTGGFIGGYERERISNERRLHERQRASGLTFDPSERRRSEMEKASLDRVRASTFVIDIDRTIAHLEGHLTPAAMADAATCWAEAAARIRVSDAKKIDLIAYSDPTKIETERTQLDLVLAEGRARLRAVYFDPRLSDEDRQHLIPTEFTGLEAYLEHLVGVQKSRFTDPENGEIANQRKIARKLGGYQLLWFRSPLEKAYTQAERERAAELERQRAAAAPRRITTEPVAPPPEPEQAPEPTPEPESAPDAEILPFFEAKGSLLDFKNKTGAELTTEQVQKMYGDFAKSGRFDLIADLRRGTGVALVESELKVLISTLDIAGRSSLLAAVPEVAPLIPWAEDLKIMGERLTRNQNPSEDPWFTAVAPMVNELVAEKLLDLENNLDGEIVHEFVRDFRGMYTPKLFRIWVHFKKNSSAGLPSQERSLLVEHFGPDGATMTRDEAFMQLRAKFDALRQNVVSGQPLPPETSDLGQELVKALNMKREELFGTSRLAETISAFKNRVEASRNKSSAQIFTELKPNIISGLKNQMHRLRSELDEAGGGSTLLRMRINELNGKIEKIEAMPAPVDDQPATLRKLISDFAELGLAEDHLNDLLVVSYFKVYTAEHPVLAQKLNLVNNLEVRDGQPVGLTATQINDLAGLLIDKMVREDLPKNFKDGASYHALLRALNAHDPENNPLALANSRIDEFRGLTTRRKIPVGAMPEAETKALLSVRANHDLKDARAEISRAVSAVVQSEIATRASNHDARRLLNLAQLNKFDADEAFAKKDFLTAELLAQKALRYCREILLDLGVVEAMTEQDRVITRAAETRAAAKQAEKKAAEEAEAAPEMEKADKDLNIVSEIIQTIDRGIEALKKKHVSVASLQDDADGLADREEKLHQLFSEGNHKEVNRLMRQMKIDCDRIANIVIRLSKEHKVKIHEPRVEDEGAAEARTAPATPTRTTTPALTGRSIFGPKSSSAPEATTPTTPTPDTTPSATASTPAAEAAPETPPTTPAPKKRNIFGAKSSPAPETPEPKKAEPAPKKASATPAATTAPKPAGRSIFDRAPAAANPEPAKVAPTTQAPETKSASPAAAIKPRKAPAAKKTSKAEVAPAAGAEVAQEFKVAGEDEPFTKPAPETPPPTTPTPKKRNIFG